MNDSTRNLLIRSYHEAQARRFFSDTGHGDMTNLNAPATEPGPLTEGDFKPRRSLEEFGHLVVGWTATIGIVAFIAGVAFRVIQ